MIAFWIFVYNGDEKYGHSSFKTRIRDSHWGLYKFTQNRTKVQEADNILFYKAGQGGQRFLGTANVETLPFSVTKLLVAKYPSLAGFDYCMKLMNLDIWQTPVPMRNVAEKLHFIKNKEKYGVYLQGGIKSISERDYKTVITHRE